MTRWTRRGWLAVALAGLLAAGFILVVPRSGDLTPRSGPPPRSASASASSLPPKASPRTLTVLALGDSVTAGTNCDCQAFPKLYVDSVGSRTGDDVHLSNEGAPGATSADVSAYLRSPAGAEAGAAADVVLLTIGANDFAPISPQILTQTCGGADDLACARPALATLASNLSAITARLHQLRGGAPTTVLITDYWNVFEDGDVADADYSARGRLESDRLTVAANAVIERSATQSAATFVDLYAPFKGETGHGDPTTLLADDGDHPNAAGHATIARTLVAAGPAAWARQH